MLTFSIAEIPFSLPGSFLTITQAKSDSGRLVIRTCSARVFNPASGPAADFFELSLTANGQEMPYTWIAQPHRLDLLGEGDSGATIVFMDTDTLIFETKGVGLRLLPTRSFAESISPSADQLHLTDPPTRGVHQLRAAADTRLLWSPAIRSGGNHSDAVAGSLSWIDFVGTSSAQGAIRFSRHECLWQAPLADFEDVLEQRSDQYSAWAARMPVVPPVYSDTAELAWLLLWNVQTPAAGALTRPAIYMSKSSMNAIWAWDHCFNALAVAGADARLAWEQILLFFDHQNELGMIPDMITDLEPVYAFTKPPIQGWTIRKLVTQLGMKESLPYLEKLYKPLCRLTDWWYAQRDYDGDGMPQYHHGNDSGWDNATIFDQGFPTEGADLAAHLVIQCETLAFIANALGKNKASLRWMERAQQQLKTLLENGVHRQHFYSPLDGKSSAALSRSLLNYIPIELGGRLPPALLDHLCLDLEPGGPFLTDWGLASEFPSSPKYEADGYWRGPIWAPSTYLIFDGLVDAGKLDHAQIIALRFCEMCVHDPGFWENYDAITGKGLRCPGYSWTAAVFILLAQWLATMNHNGAA